VCAPAKVEVNWLKQAQSAAAAPQNFEQLHELGAMRCRAFKAPRDVARATSIV
jgi:hypothetical protein